MNMAEKQVWITSIERKAEKELKRNERKEEEEMIREKIYKTQTGMTPVGEASFGDPRSEGILNKKAGITLVALVITVIVLLILAGATVTIALSGDGVFSKADNAVQRWNNKVSEEDSTIRNILSYEYTVDSTGANAPVLPTGDMTVEYVTWTESEGTYTPSFLDVRAASAPAGWYNYNEGKWANIKTTSKTANNPEAADAEKVYNEAYWVWIPRYAYQIKEKPNNTSASENYRLNNPEFNIVFLRGISDEPVTPSELGEGKIVSSPSQGEVGKDYVVHPAFNFGGAALPGIWVAKFEASSSNPSAQYGGGNTIGLKVNVKPTVTSWRYITVSNIFTVCQAITGTAGVLEGNTTADPHMMKNSEWGAVAYLTQSKYGQMRKDTNGQLITGLGQVWNNPSKQYITGSAASDTYTATAKKDAYSTSGDDSIVAEVDAYNTGNGPKASTTGNVYGVYDMAGGAWEYVAAYIDNNTARESTNLTNLRNADARYKEVYAVSSTDSSTEATEAQKREANYQENTSKYGDAVYETSYAGTGSTSWQNDYSYFPYSGYPVFARGGGCSYSSSAGVFFFNYYSGVVYSGNSFRPVLVAQ